MTLWWLVVLTWYEFTTMMFTDDIHISTKTLLIFLLCLWIVKICLICMYFWTVSGMSFIRFNKSCLNHNLPSEQLVLDRELALLLNGLAVLFPLYPYYCNRNTKTVKHWFLAKCLHQGPACTYVSSFRLGDLQFWWSVILFVTQAILGLFGCWMLGEWDSWGGGVPYTPINTACGLMQNSWVYLKHELKRICMYCPHIRTYMYITACHHDALEII